MLGVSIPFINFPDDHGREGEGPFFSFGIFEDGIRRKPERANIHRHDFFEIFFFKSGSGEFFSDFNRFSLSAGSAVFVSPGQVHGWPTLKKLSGYIICFSTSFYAQRGRKPDELFDYPFFFTPKGKAPTVKIDSVTKGELFSMFSLIEKEWSQNRSRKHDVIHSLLDAILVKFERHFVSNDTDKTESQNLAKAFVILVERNYRFRHTIEDHAAKLNTTPPTLIKAVKNHLGQTPHELITDRMVLEARRLLLDPSKKVYDVAHYLGFDDASNFAKYLKKACGKLPVDLRNPVLF